MGVDWNGTFWAIVIFIFTWLGDLGKAWHEDARGVEKVSYTRVFRALPSVLIISAAAVVAANWLHANYGYEMLTGGVIGGMLSYVGLEWISTYAKSWLEKLKPPVRTKVVIKSTLAKVPIHTGNTIAWCVLSAIGGSVVNAIWAPQICGDLLRSFVF